MLGEKKMNVTLYAYNLFEKRIREKGKKDVEYFEKDFVECVKALMIRKPNDRKYELGNKKKIIYINDFEYMQNQHMLFLVFKSAEYGKIRKVVDTDTLEERKTKKKGKKDYQRQLSVKKISLFKTEKIINGILGCMKIILQGQQTKTQQL